MNTSVPVFRSQFLAANQKVTSGLIAAMGNKVVLTATIINIASATACNIYIDGTYNGGESWHDNIVGSALAPTAFGVPSPVSKTLLDYSHVCVRVEAGAATLFDVTLAFSQQ